MRSLWGWILTSTYLTKRLSEEERKKRDLAGGRTALLIYSEGRGLLASDPLPFRRLLAGSVFFTNFRRPLTASTAFS